MAAQGGAGVYPTRGIPLHRPVRYPPATMTRLFEDIAAFFAEHDHCGEWHNRSPEDNSRVIVTCSFGAVLNRLNQDEDAGGGGPP